ncbi:hypothetical protein [Mycobacterium sp. 1081908.1]|uniref:hypothetical protein n=1 Tax=Mycobacterium sp. 1081908.1 TaxID=1834066 RepID=UPI0007FCC6ED|nr:hypothetical protein [Mycobacterium sp. 1081908.1]OBK50840.1 hypothetical protein A5655_24645 [Mycobacterium sp. 1081908.1]
MTWTRYEGRALADVTLTGGALDAALEDHVRVQNPHLTDVRLESVTATESYDTRLTPPGRWYRVTYLAEGADL